MAAERDGAIAERDAAVAERDRVISQILLANARAYGSKSEKVLPHQLGLFNDMEAAFEPSAPEPEAEEVAKPRKKRKRRECVDWSRYDTVVVEHRLEGEDASCPACGSKMEDMGYQVKRVFKIRPAHVYVEEHRQHKAVCRECSHANEADGGETPVQIAKADMPAVTPVEGSCASASLVAYVMDRKYCMGLPLYRISSDLRASEKLTVSRQAMAGWVIESWRSWLSPVRDHMKSLLTAHTRLHIDETRVQVLKEPGRKPESMSWAWVFCTLGRDGPPIYIFKYDPSRGHEVPHAFLPKGWKGAIITDGHKAYNALMDKRPGDIVRVSCLVHILRKFKDVLKGAKKPVRNSAAEKAIAMIDRMFMVDNDFDELPAGERKA
ncbi:MAG: IS66 family transposase, partial [Eggerthellaceae bacterium]|nr:IS66 family transposase [Eggerthellaceae bacterium]